MLKRILILLIVLIPLGVSHKTAYAGEKGIAGISAVLNKIDECDENKLMCTTGSVNFRKEASSDSEIYYTIKEDTTIFAVDESDNWIKIIHKGETGYIHSKFTTEIYNINNITDEEIEILQRIVEAEATGGSIESKMNVASVIINRLNHTSFPSTVKDVVFQKKQFTPIADKRYFTVEVTETTIQAVQNVLNNGVTTEAIYFANMSKLPKSTKKAWDKSYTYLFTDDINHSFYK